MSHDKRRNRNATNPQRNAQTRKYWRVDVIRTDPNCESATYANTYWFEAADPAFAFGRNVWDNDADIQCVHIRERVLPAER